MSGNSLLDVFNQTGLTINKSGGAVVSFGTITGYDSPQTMNKLWSVSVRGSGLKGGVSSPLPTSDLGLPQNDRPMQEEDFPINLPERNTFRD